MKTVMSSLVTEHAAMVAIIMAAMHMYTEPVVVPMVLPIKMQRRIKRHKTSNVLLR